jgi:hypothetical protein
MTCGGKREREERVCKERQEGERRGFVKRGNGGGEREREKRERRERRERVDGTAKFFFQGFPS